MILQAFHTFLIGLSVLLSQDVFISLAPTKPATLGINLTRLVMFVVNLRKETIRELDLLIEHLSSSGALTVCARLFVGI